jgi:hypothetical protein
MFMMPLGILKIKNEQGALSNDLSSYLGYFGLHWVTLSLLVCFDVES